MNKVPWKVIDQDPLRRDWDFDAVVSSAHHQRINYPLRGGQRTIEANNDLLIVAETYYADVRFYKGQSKTGQDKELPITGETTIKAKTPLDDYTKPMIRLEYTTLETYHRFEVPSKGNGSKPKPIIFHALVDMDKRSALKEEDSKSESGAGQYLPPNPDNASKG